MSDHWAEHLIGVWNGLSGAEKKSVERSTISELAVRSRSVSRVSRLAYTRIRRARGNIVG